tara:strand:+ start:1350 stop:1517 length:168 start_codon:yes stop_codon:yes gene_type:complete
MKYAHGTDLEDPTTEVKIRLLFSAPPTKEEIIKYLQELIEDDSLGYTLTTLGRDD